MYFRSKRRAVFRVTYVHKIIDYIQVEAYVFFCVFLN